MNPASGREWFAPAGQVGLGLEVARSTTHGGGDSDESAVPGLQRPRYSQNVLPLMNVKSLGYLTPTLLLSALQPGHAGDWTDLSILSPVTPTPGWINETLRKEDPYKSAWNVGVLYWTRFEVKENGGFVGPGSLADFRRDVDNDNSYLLQKVLPRIGYTSKWYDVFVQGRHSSVTGDDRSSSGNGTLTVSTNGVVTAAGPVGGGSSPESDGPIDLQQAYITLGNHKEFPLSLKVGRQELVFGEQGPVLK